MSPKYSGTKIHKFIKTYFESKEGTIADESEEAFTVSYPNNKGVTEYTYQPALAKEKKIPLLTNGSPAFQEILKDCLEEGILCQITLKPKGTVQALVKKYFKDAPFDCDECDHMTVGEKCIGVCIKTPQCYHKINNGKIASIKVTKREAVRYFRFYFSAIFQNKLRPKTEERITILVDEQGQIVDFSDLDDALVSSKTLEIHESTIDLNPEVFDKLKAAADAKLAQVLKEKLAIYDLMLSKEVKAKLRSFDKRLKGERREKVISRKHDFDSKQWQTSYEALLKREEESFITHIAIRFINLLVINTTRLSFVISLENKTAIDAAFVLGVTSPTELTCPICGQASFEGYATEDGQYVCPECIKQSVDTAKIYSTKQPLLLDEALNEYLEKDAGFVCSVCGERTGRLLEFKCSHDNSSICIFHYGLCDLCGAGFSEKNLSVSKESKRKLCPTHTTQCSTCGEIMAVDEGRLCKASGKRECSTCARFTKCTSCQQEYSTNALVGDKCPACSNLTNPTDQTLISTVVAFDSAQRKTSKWLIGKNALNAIVVAKGVFSSTLYVVEDGKVVAHRSISFLEKFRGH